MTWHATLFPNLEDGDPTWQPQDEAEPRYIGTFDPTHRAHLYVWFCRRADEIATKYAHQQLWGSLLWGDSDNADDAFHSMVRDHEAMERRPLAWLLGTPFMVALGLLLIGDGNDGIVADWEREAEHPGITKRFEGTAFANVRTRNRERAAQRVAAAASEGEF